MLSLFNSFVVPGVDNVTLYQDDQDDHLFWMFKEIPTVVEGTDGPMFNLISYARDFRLSADENTDLRKTETEGGLLSVTLECAVSQEDQTKIREFIAKDLLNWKPWFRLRPSLKGKAVRMALRKKFSRQVKLAYPVWTKGSCAFYPLPTGGDTFVKGQEGSKEPSLTGNNVSNYSVLLGQEGMRLFRASVEEGFTVGTVNYDLSFVCRIPNLTVTVKGKTEDAYEEIKKHTRVKEIYRKGGKTTTYSYPAVSSLEELQEMVTSLDITVDSGDFRSGAPGVDGQNITQSINQLAFTLIQNYLQNVFFAPGFAPGLKAEKLGTDPFAHNPDRDANTAPPPANQLWLKDFKQEWKKEIDFTFTARQNLEISKHPNTSLFSIIPPAEVKKRIIEADLSQPYFHIMDVPVRVTANMEKDPIAAIQVFMEYDQTDEKTGQKKTHSEAFTFDKGDEVFRFRTVMARDKDGAPKDTYRYYSKITYKSSSKSEVTPEKTTNMRSLILGYDELDFVEVQVIMGAIPSDLVERIQIHFKYPGVNLPSAEADIFLTSEKPEANWFTYTDGQDSREYEYQVTFFLADGQKLQLPKKRELTNRLVLNAPFDDRLRITFVPQGTFPPLNSIVVSTRYNDAEASYNVEDLHTFTSLGDTWTWEPSLRDRTKRMYEYKVIVTYSDGSAHEGEWQPGEEGTILVGDVAREMLEIEVVPSLLDMDSQWKLVIVRLEYSDPGNTIDLKETFKITAANANDSFVWKIPIKDPQQRSFNYTVQAFGYDSANKKVLGPMMSTESLLVLEV